MARKMVAGETQGSLLCSQEGLSFWGGVDSASGKVVDAHHPLHQQSLAGKLVMLPTSRGSCTGSGVLLELIQNGNAPAALIFREAESVLTLGALVAHYVFDLSLPVIRLSALEFDLLSQQTSAHIQSDRILFEGGEIGLEPASEGAVQLTEADKNRLAGGQGEAVRIAMQILCAMAQNEGATGFLDVSKVHIDGCIYAGDALRRFAQVFDEMGAKVTVPTTMNSISVEYARWRQQGMDEGFGEAAQALADAYLNMGCQPTFTCAPYLLENPPKVGENIAWAESNAVIYANSVLGARTAKHPDFLDLCIALTGRSPATAMYQTEQRSAQRIIEMAYFETVDDAFWPMLGYLAGSLAPDCIPLIRGVAHLSPNEDNLKALCGAFGTTSGAPMLHVEGITPEADQVLPEAQIVKADKESLQRVWQQFNPKVAPVQLVALGSPHFSVSECRDLAELLEGKACKEGVVGMITMGQGSLTQARAEGLVGKIESAGFQIHGDLCWCSISEPVFPVATQTLMTNSGKYAHYGPGLSQREIRFGSLADCVAAAMTGRSPSNMPSWLA
ncbi:aconitase X [Rhodanobacter aciditrophus]|uniref:Aconitase X n=1 Tax=Rhodanobacter aciditrophus TaxID=1623218 RepID=A0ABW4B119_9GAMM